MLVSARKTQLRWILLTFGLVVLADQVTKAIIMATIEQNRRIRTDEIFFQFTHQRNDGLMGGVFSGSPLLVLVLPIVATLILLYLYRYLNVGSRLQALAFGLVCGGAIGNLVDRVRLGSVTDFLQFHFYFIPFPFYWKLYPAFNVADSAVCVGVAILVLTWNVGTQTDHDAASPV